MIIEVEQLARRFGPLEAVKGVSFDVRPGEIFGFLGPNGAGKTTTINMLCTLLTPSSGTARVNGFDVESQRSDVRRSIGLVFQQTTLDEYLSADQNLRFHAYAYAIPGDVREKRMSELMEMVELSDRRNGSVRTYSGGMKRRLEIARGLLHHPKVLFLDEPTLGLDPQTRRHIWDYLLRLREQEGLTIFLTTHYMDEAEYSDRIAVIDHGDIVGLDTPDGLKRSVGGDVVTLEVADGAAASSEIHARYGLDASASNGTLSFSVAEGREFLPDFVKTFSQPIHAIEVRRPTLEDVFLHLTGREIRDEELDGQAQMLQGMARRFGR
ncbi:MAG TPA: ATP-binding cassette domain-containing protein [Candidatus Limnocylindrales bacterium]|nr:ATP-binding cassette domain-containing protein [Candidatus Limnocylindrales bacterium]